MIFNLHVEHSENGIAASRETFRKLIDAGMSIRVGKLILGADLLEGIGQELSFVRNAVKD